MKITNVRAIYPRYRQPLAGWRPHLWQIAVAIETDVGVTGWGYGGGGEAALPIINGHFRQLLQDRAINERPRHWPDLGRALRCLTALWPQRRGDHGAQRY
ncbi:MAG: hypothetical protein R2867_28705 [Caldilineaceae bacterium]